MKFSLAVMLSTMVLTAVQAGPLNVYFGTGDRAAKGIHHSTFDPDTGRLSPPVLAAEIGSPGFLALHPDGDKLYAVVNLKEGPGVAGYSIGRNGRLKLINTSLTHDGGGAHVAVHPSGRFLLTAQYGGGSVALFPLDDLGQLGDAVVTEHEGGSQVVPGRQDSPHPHWCGYSPDGQFAFVPDLGLDGIVIYRVDAAKPAITPHGFAASIPGGGARHMRFSTDGRFIYLLNELSLSLTTFAYDAETGITRQLTTTPSLDEAVKGKETFNSGAEVLVHPNGRFVYSSNRGHDSVTVYRADADTGELTVIEVEPIRGAWPRHINLDPSGQWLLAAGAHSGTVSVHRVDSETGELTYQRNGIASVPAPICILFAD
jgi:6-phosphogluconolactonase